MRPRFTCLPIALAACALAGGCRTRPLEPEVDQFRPRIVECGDPMPVNVKLEAPVVWVGTGDFNDDGAPDLVGGSRGISIAYGRGDGTFVPPSDPNNRLVPSFAGVADFDRNGADDVVVARAGKQVELFKGLKHVEMPQVIPVLQAFMPPVTWLATGDHDGDHIPDAVVLEFDGVGGNATVLYGDGIGSDFESPFAMPLQSQPHGYLAVQDIDADGRDDVLVPSESAVLALRSGGRNKSSRDYHAAELPAPAAALAFGDFDEDKVLDLAAVATLVVGDNVFTGSGRGDATFRSPRSMRAGQNPRNLVVLDWNLDGHLDLAVCNSGVDHTVSFLYGRGDGTFSDPQVCQAVTFDATGGANWVATDDFNRDGRPDLAFAYYNGLQVVLNRLK